MVSGWEGILCDSARFKISKQKTEVFYILFLVAGVA